MPAYIISKYVVAVGWYVFVCLFYNIQYTSRLSDSVLIQAKDQGIL